MSMFTILHVQNFLSMQYPCLVISTDENIVAGEIALVCSA